MSAMVRSRRRAPSLRREAGDDRRRAPGAVGTGPCRIEDKNAINACGGSGNSQFSWCQRTGDSLRSRAVICLHKIVIRAKEPDSVFQPGTAFLVLSEDRFRTVWKRIRAARLSAG